jgi:aminoglycoside 3-N-acetyltransferase
MFTKQDIISQLNTFREAVGHHVHVHSSLKAIGEVEGRGETILSCLIDFFTQQGGMVSFPTHTWDLNVLEFNKKETCLGVLSKLALERADGVRSPNPTHSMVIFGEGAEEYAKWDENILSSTDPNGCYGKLDDTDGYILLIGVGQEKNTYIHAVEEQLGIPQRCTEEFYNTVVIDTYGSVIHKPIHFIFEEFGDISYSFGKLEPAFRYHGCIVEGGIGDAKVQLCSAKKIKSVLEMIHASSDGQEFLLDNIDSRSIQTLGRYIQTNLLKEAHNLEDSKLLKMNRENNNFTIVQSKNPNALDYTILIAKSTQRKELLSNVIAKNKDKAMSNITK